MPDDGYVTPEGFTLYRPLVLPDVRDFAELFTVERPWDFATMNHHNGHAQADTPEDITRDGYERVVSRFLAVRNLPGGHWCVTPTAPVLDAIYSDGFAFFDRVSFEAILHESNGRVLIVAQASGIIASRYLAYIDPATMPGAVQS